VRETVLCSDIAGHVPSRKSAVIAVGNLGMVVEVVFFTHDGLFGKYSVQDNNCVSTFRRNENPPTLWLLNLEEELCRLCRKRN